MFGLVDLLSLSRKKRDTKSTSKKTERTASAKNTPPERPTAPKPNLKNKEKVAPEVPTIPVVEQQQPKRKTTEEQVAKQTDLTLPNGIERKYDPKTNRFYYLNHKDKTTSWSPPDGKMKKQSSFES